MQAKQGNPDYYAGRGLSLISNSPSLKPPPRKAEANSPLPQKRGKQSKCGNGEFPPTLSYAYAIAGRQFLSLHAATRNLIVFLFAFVLISCIDDSESGKRSAERHQTPEQELAEINHRIDSLQAFIDKQPILKPAVVKSNEGLFQTLQSVGLNLKQSLKIINTLADTVELGTLKAGQVFWVGFDKKDTSNAVLFRYAENPATIHFLIIPQAAENGGADEQPSSDSVNSAGAEQYEWYNQKPQVDNLAYKYALVQKPVQVRYAQYEGSLKEGGNLYNTLRDIGIPQDMVAVVAGVLECKVSFRTDARIGDKFKILLKETWFNPNASSLDAEANNFNDSSIWIGGRVLYASYNGERVKHSEAFWYQESDPKSSFNAHYSEDGEALIHSGLRYPLDRLHITSTYGSRIHPVTGARSFHAGVDYRGAVGTPVYAVADGIIVQSSFSEYNGNYITIKHSDNSQSWYLHLSQRGVKSGQKVRGRQVIGKVGNTGRSSGPHLHFAVKQPNGSWMNPLQKRMIATPKLDGEKLAALVLQISEIRKTLGETENAEPKKINDSTEATVRFIFTEG